MLYSNEHYREFRPADDEFSYNHARWSVFSWEKDKAIYCLRQRISNCSLIASRELLIEALEERFKRYEGQKIPVIIFSKGGCQWLEDQANSGADALGLDWTIDIGLARKRVGDMVALQGNMDPTVLYASPERIRAEVADILASYGSGTGHVFNLGHGIHQHVNPEHAKVFVDAVHELSKPYHM